MRWNRYLHAFYGKDFIEELRDVDPDLSLLDPTNKLLSLNSMDSLTLAEAFVTTGLAKSGYREQILQKFSTYALCKLPEMEGQWIVTTGAHKRFDPHWWGNAEGGREKIKEDGYRKYHFSAVRSVFERDLCRCDVDAPDRLNPFQRAIVKLVQNLSLDLGLHHKRNGLVEKRAMVKRLLCNNPQALTSSQVAFLDSQLANLEEQHLDAMDAVRGQKAAIDNLIKQVVVAMEDDVYAQFYNPALERLRKAAAEWDVELSQIERTTILTNNRAFAKVTPQATYQFDLPKRDIAIAEALKAAYALHKDVGPLLADPEFGTLAKMFAGQSIAGGVADGTVKSVLPGLNSADQQSLLFADATSPPKFGTELEKLIPDPAIYKFETGTGYEVRPVIQPDGQSVAFDFNYLYTTDLLEPTRPDERSLGRVKRHFINTEVQLGNLEWREISRYEVALKAARNSRGVPLLEDVPVAGVLFRPLPQAKKSIQKNIIIGQATIYPTVQDLLGVRPASQAYLDHQKVAKQGYEEFLHDDQRLDHLNQILETQASAMIRDESRQFLVPAITSPTAAPAEPSKRSTPQNAQTPLLTGPDNNIQQMSYEQRKSSVWSPKPAASPINPSAPRRIK